MSPSHEPHVISLPRQLVRRWTQLVLGLAGWGLAIALMIRSGLGLGPWDALHVGIARHTGIGVGTASIAAGLAILAAGTHPTAVWTEAR